MAINLSDLTGASTSGDILAEAQSTADFLDSCPLLKNLADPSGATDAKQFTATKQPKTLPLIDGDGYCYLPPVSGNYASTPDDSALDITGDITIECDFIVPEIPVSYTRVLVGKYNTTNGNRSYRLNLKGDGTLGIALSSTGAYDSSYDKSRDFSSVLSGKTRATVKATWRQSDGRTQFFIKESDGSFTQVGADHTIAAPSIYNSNQEVEIGSSSSGINAIGSYVGVFGARIYASVDGTDKRLDIDFTAPNVRHGDTAFECATGQIVTINQAGNDPATVIKKPVLRFDGVDDGFEGLFSQTITDGYMFAAFSLLGNGGESHGRVFSAAAFNSNDVAGGGFVFRKNGSTENLNLTIDASVSKSISNAFTSDLGDYVLESRLNSGNATLRINGTAGESYADTFNINAVKFNIGEYTSGDYNGCLDLEYLALFPATLTDSQADAVRNYINNRNNVFYRWDTDGYYFYNPQDLSSGAVTSWNGRIVGSDNGDADLLAAQTTSADRPTKSGLSVTFADNTDHLDIPSTTQAGWQIVGTSLGTFAYKVDSDAITELNLLGNLGNTSYRKTGDLYGIILLPESATNRDINEAKRLLTDRGASESATADLNNAWRTRTDIVQFDGGDMSDVTNASRAWQGTNLTSFSTPLPSATNVSNSWNGITSLISFTTELPQSTNCSYAWYNNNSLSSFTTTDIKNCNNFTSAWQNCSSLTQFPQDAKLGTEASNVNFSSAWRSSGLTSFSTPLPTATNVGSAWRSCASLTSFSSELPSATILISAFQDCTQLEQIDPIQSSNATSWYYTFYNCRALTEFPVSDTSSGTDFFGTWRNCRALTQFPLLNCNSGQRFSWTWNGCLDLEDFPAGFFDNWNPSSISEGPFGDAWNGCTSLTAQSVENILTSIDTSGKYATSTGESGGTALADATIDIDYDVSTGSLTAATLSAIETLNGRGWSVNINNEIIVPNILQLEPAAAYSLRSFDADADPNVVNVRRSSDGATSDFTASEVSDGTLVAFVGAGNDGFVTTWYDQKIINETGDAYGTTISGTADGTSEYHLNLAPAVAGEYYRVRYTLSNLNPRGRVRFRNAVDNAGLTAVAGTAAFSYITQDGSYETVVPSDDGLSLWFTADAGQSFDYSGISIQQVDNYQNNSSQTTASSQPLIVENGVLVTEGGEAALSFDGAGDFISIDHSDLYGQATLDSYYVTSTSDTEYVYPANNGTSPYGFVAENTGSTNLYNSYGTPTLFANGVEFNGTTRSGIYNVLNGYKLAVHQGASTTDSRWATQDIRFGGYYNNSTSYTYTGKLQEMIFFNTDQSANRAAIETNINDHFDIY